MAAIAELTNAINILADQMNAGFDELDAKLTGIRLLNYSTECLIINAGVSDHVDMIHALLVAPLWERFLIIWLQTILTSSKLSPESWSVDGYDGR
jgi:hypothetical protein